MKHLISINSCFIKIGTVGLKNSALTQRNMESKERVLRLHPAPSFFKAPFQMFSNLKKNRNLLKNLIARDFKVNYHGHVLGYFWSLLEPLALTGIFFLVFVILRGQSDTILPLKIMIGILIFNSFAKTLSSCTTCLIQNSSLIQQVYFPREVFPSAIAGFRFVNLCLSIKCTAHLVTH